MTDAPLLGTPTVERVIRAGARLLARRVDLTFEGRRFVPRDGPVLIVARHYHHLYDACALLDIVPRPLRFLVALDWARGRGVRRGMELLCRAAGWPVVLRGERLAEGRSAYAARESLMYTRRGLAQAAHLLRRGQALAIFPEAYPNIDPIYTPKRGDEFLPFRPGFARIVELAERGGAGVPVVPAGFHYERDQRWRVLLRFGPPCYRADAPDRAAFVRSVEQAVRALSRLAP